jgi:hypothetical protein
MKPPKRTPDPQPTLAQRLLDTAGALWRGRSGKEQTSKTQARSGDKPSSMVSTAATDASASQADATERDELERMYKDLTAALDARPNNRKALPHLAAIHRHLGKTGLQVFERAPLALLTHAHDQLLLLAGGHGELRDGPLIRVLSEHIARRGQDVTVVDDVAWRTPRDSDLMVMEGRMSDFMAANESAPKPVDQGKPQP